MNSTSEAHDRRGVARWGLSFLLMAAAHVASVVVLSRHTAIPPMPAEPPAVLLDLEPWPEPMAESAPEPPVPEPLAAQRELAPPPLEPLPREVQPPPEPAPPRPELPSPELPSPELPSPELPPPESPALPAPTAAPVRPLSPPRPPSPHPPRTPVIPRVAPAEQSAPSPAPRPSAPAPATSREAVAAATSSWQGRLQAHLTRFKRYPAEAQMRRQEGTSMLRFTMTRDGRVLSFGLASSSGHEALDREALSLLDRAQPLPPLPPEVSQATIELVVPLRFQLR
jgi:protein TonB